MRKYKHRFVLVDRDEERSEIATCVDEMTSNFLADHYRSVYKGNKESLSVIHCYRGQETVIV